MSFPFSIEDVVTASIIGLLGFLGVVFRKKLYFWWLKRRIQPKLKGIVESYRQEIGAYVETEPKLIVTDRKPTEQVYGIIFVTPDEIPVIELQFILSIPVACSLKKARLLLDTNLKRALFDFFSWRLAVVHEREDLASKIYDHAVKAYSNDFDAIQKLHSEEKLANIVLQEALRRLRGYSDLRQISSGDIREFSEIFREWAKRDFGLVIVAEKEIYEYVDLVMVGLSKHQEVLLLTRGTTIAKLADVVNACKRRDKRISDYKKDTDSWYYPGEERTVSSLRVWLSHGFVQDVVRLVPR